MARKRYPSDDNRLKQRPHVKIHLSIRNHRKTVGRIDSPEFRGQLWGLYFVAAERFAGKLGGKVHLSHRDLQWILGTSRWKSCEKSLRSLCTIMEYPVEFPKEPAQTAIIQIPKFPIKQGYAPRLRDGGPGDSADSGSLQGTKEPLNQGTALSATPNAGDGTEEDGSEKEKKVRPPPDPWALRAATRLRDLVLEVMEGARVPKTEKGLAKWARSLMAMKPTPEQIEFAIEWLYSPSNQARGQYRIDVRAPSSLSEKWDQVVAGIAREKARESGGEGDGALAEIAANLKRSEDRDNGWNEGGADPGHRGPGSSSGQEVGLGDAIRDVSGWGGKEQADRDIPVPGSPDPG